MAGTDKATVGVRTTLADRAAIEQRHATAGLMQKVSTGNANDPAADHHYLAGFHERIPMQNGSRGSSSRLPSPVT